jgi:hypothetical protein
MAGAQVIAREERGHDPIEAKPVDPWSIGFRDVGTYAKHAQLDVVGRDVVILERLLTPNLVEPRLGIREQALRSLPSSVRIPVHTARTRDPGAGSP